MRNFITTILILISINAFSQKEANNWYFGAHAGITFNDGNPEVLMNSAMSFQFGTSSISDSAGNLLFYTDGEHVYNRNHQQMPNGYDLKGFSQSQTSMIVQRP